MSLPYKLWLTIKQNGNKPYLEFCATLIYLMFYKIQHDIQEDRADLSGYGLSFSFFVVGRTVCNLLKNNATL